MKRVIYILLIVSIFVLTIFIFIKPIIISLAKKQLGRVFTESAVSVRDCDLRPLRQLTLLDVEINENGVYDFKVKEVTIQYNPFSIIKRSLLNVSLKDAIVVVNLPKKNMLELRGNINPGSRKAFLAQSLELLNLNLNLKLKDLELEAKISSEVNLSKQLINYCNLKLDSLDSQGLRIEGASLEVSQMRDSGELYINKLRYNKAKIKEIRSNARLKDRVLFLDSLSAEALDGRVQGDLSFSIDKEREYLANLELIDLNLETFVNDFDLNKKFRMTGRLSGTVAFKGKGLNINALTGDFSTAEQGGMLVIKDDRFLKNLARNSKQPLDILVESFKDYHYNTGVMRLSMDKGNLLLDIALNGEAGKRNLNITLHDFSLRRGEL